ncbi:hypothetical protein U1Q18_008314 [Sarracenia purpurea var. burkii]
MALQYNHPFPDALTPSNGVSCLWAFTISAKEGLLLMLVEGVFYARGLVFTALLSKSETRMESVVFVSSQRPEWDGDTAVLSQILE